MSKIATPKDLLPHFSSYSNNIFKKYSQARKKQFKNSPALIDFEDFKNIYIYN
jgi:hypothetical protein